MFGNEETSVWKERMVVVVMVVVVELYKLQKLLLDVLFLIIKYLLK